MFCLWQFFTFDIKIQASYKMDFVENDNAAIGDDGIGSMCCAVVKVTIDNHDDDNDDEMIILEKL